MTSSSDDSPPHDESAPKKQEDVFARGATAMNKVIKASNKGIKFEVPWNEDGQPIEPNGATLMSYVGAIVRETVPITIDNWRKKEYDNYKDFIWKDIQTAFIIDDVHRRYILKAAGRSHRWFRSYLTSKWVYDKKKNVNQLPPANYDAFIKEHEWKAFVAKRIDPKFKELSYKNRERASKNIYPYRRSHLGYARLKQKLLKDGVDVKSMPRHTLWKLGRLNKNGVIDNKNVQDVLDNCENLSQSLPKDELQDDPLQDILAKALNVPEYPGRVRVAGLGITHKHFSGKKKRKRKNPTAEEMNALIAEVQQLKARVTEMEMEKKLNDKKAMDNQLFASAEDSASYHVPEGTSPCELRLSSPTHRVVAKGKVFNVEGVMLHSKPLPPETVKVLLELAIEADANLPVPDDYEGNTTVGDAIGTYLAWPVNLIGPRVQTPKKRNGDMSNHTGESIYTPKKPKKIDIQKPSPAKKSLSGMPRKKPEMSKIQKPNGKQAKSVATCFNKVRVKQGLVSNLRGPPAQRPFTKVRENTPFCTYLSIHVGKMTVERPLVISMDEDIFGIDKYHEYLGVEQINELLEHKWIGVSVICTYVRYLYFGLIRGTQKENRFSFLSPHKTTHELGSCRSQYIAEVLKKYQGGGRMFLAPVNVGKHWVLIVINTISRPETIYYLDSMHGDPRDWLCMKEIFCNALHMYRAGAGVSVPKTKLMKINWVHVKGPRQPNGTDCGYYVMRLMKEIILRNEDTTLINYFPDYRCESYSDQQLTEVKEEWATHVVQQL